MTKSKLNNYLPAGGLVTQSAAYKKSLNYCSMLLLAGLGLSGATHAASLTTTTPANMLLNNVSIVIGGVQPPVSATLTAQDNVALHTGQVYQVAAQGSPVAGALPDALYNGANSQLTVPALVNGGGLASVTLTLTAPNPLTFTVASVNVTGVFTGPQGATGATGPNGAIGPQGVTGVSGATGAAGSAGATGATGSSGAAGPLGDGGAVGAAGPAGVASTVPGAPGSPGVNGINGINNTVVGATGATGPTGLAGATGSAGTLPSGNKGDLAYWNGEAWNTLTIGATGATLQNNAAGALAWSSVAPTCYHLGDTGPAGGIVYDNGGVACGTSGHEVAPANSNYSGAAIGSAAWGCNGQNITGLGADGAANTTAIISQCDNGTNPPSTPSAAKLASQYYVPGSSIKTGWFLPSTAEAIVIGSGLRTIDGVNHTLANGYQYSYWWTF